MGAGGAASVKQRIPSNSDMLHKGKSDMLYVIFKYK